MPRCSLSIRETVAKKTVTFHKYVSDVNLMSSFVKILKLTINNLVCSPSFRCKRKTILSIKKCSEDEVPVLTNSELAASEDQPVNCQCL